MFSRSSGSAPTGDSTQKVEALKQEFTAQLAAANAQELVNKVNEKCYSRCVTSPSGALSAKEQKAISNCADRFLEAYNIVSRTYVDRITRQRASSSAGNVDVASMGGLNNEGFR